VSVLPSAGSLPTSGQPFPPPLPVWAWGVGILSVLGELAFIGEAGVRSGNPGMPISMVLTALATVWVTYGVLAGRTTHLVVALLVMGVVAVAASWRFLEGTGHPGWALAQALLALAAPAALVALVRSPYHAWQRTRHDLSEVPIGGVLLLAAVSGLLGPLSGPDHDRPGMHVVVGSGAPGLSGAAEGGPVTLPGGSTGW
jgi:hypothetical protein